ncbi:MAG: hypothetical protein M3O50_19180 [Myxococcota bacterium]|nr:hypothetical protein [Myxococcota bacterium]
MRVLLPWNDWRGARVANAALVGCAAPLAMACSLSHLDAIAVLPGGNDAGLLEGATLPEGSDDADMPGASVDSGILPDVRAGDAMVDVTDAMDGSVVPLPDGETPNDPCSVARAPVRQWTFDADMQGWTLFTATGVQGSLLWNGTVGMPTRGALQLDVTPDVTTGFGLVHARYLTSALGDLSGRTISAWLWVETGAPRLKLYVLTGPQYIWADNGEVPVAPRTWTCVSMPVSSPLYKNRPTYDPTNVVRLGFEMLSTSSTPSRVYIDTVRYY